MSGKSIRAEQSAVKILLTSAFVVAIGLIWTGYADTGERILTLRYLLFALSGLVAFATPYLLFPDPNAALIQLGNLNNPSLRSYLFKKISPVAWPVILLFFVILFGDLSGAASHLFLKSVYFLISLILFLAIVIFSAARYVKSGPDSQFWKESEKGKKLRQDAAHYFKYPMDPGSVPSLINTILIVLFGSVPILIGTILQGMYPSYAELFLMTLMLLVAVRVLRSQSDTFVRNYYSTNAFFREFFGSNLKGEEQGERREVEQLWWVPAPIRMHVWQFLVQTDRKLPAGRVVFAGHIVLLFLAYQRPDSGFLLVSWILFSLLHHLFLLLTLNKEMAPGWLHRWIASPAVWFAARFWMQLRWVFPILIGMNVQYFIFGIPDFGIQAIVISIYLLSSALVSVMGSATLSKEAKV